MEQEVVIELDGVRYVWSGEQWYDGRTHLIPPGSTLCILNQKLQAQLAQKDLAITKPGDLVREATRAKNAEQYERAVRLAQKCLEIAPNNPAAASVLSSALRELGKAREAIEVTEPFARCQSAPVLTTRAAALCDECRWDEALATIRRALALGQSDSTFAVRNRIKKNAPDLFK